jgi:hypothetical protein
MSWALVFGMEEYSLEMGTAGGKAFTTGDELQMTIKINHLPKQKTINEITGFKLQNVMSEKGFSWVAIT